MATLRLPNLDAPEPAISRFELSRHAAGEGTAARRAEIEHALANDAALKAKYDSVVDEQRALDGQLKLDAPLARFLEVDAAPVAHTTLVARITSLFSGRGLAFAGTLVAAAAFLVLVSRTPEAGSDASIVLKGDARVGFLVREDRGAHFGHDGEQLTSGDQIQFAVRDDVEHEAMVLVGVDGRGSVTVYDAEQIGQQRTKGDTKTRLLKDSVVLDDSTGAERFFVVYGNGSVSAVRATVENAAKALASSHGDLSSTERLPLPSSFVQSSVHIVKVAR